MFGHPVSFSQFLPNLGAQTKRLFFVQLAGFDVIFSKGIIELMENKEITIEDLARMVEKGFNGVDLRFDKIDLKFDKIEDRLERIEKLLIAEHQRRIEKLEAEVKELRELLAVK